MIQKTIVVNEHNEEFIIRQRSAHHARERRIQARRRRALKCRIRRGSLIFLTLILFIAAAFLLVNVISRWTSKSYASNGVNSNVNNPYELIELPEWINEQLLPVNEYSRPGKKLDAVRDIVVHYTGNPGTTAAQNRSYFASLARTKETYASSHFIIDIDGTIIQTVPLDEIAYCSNHRNNDSISIEVCHPTESGQFTAAAEQSLTRLVNWLTQTYDLHTENVIRHYDVSGKICPKYYVENESAWTAFLNGLSIR